ncbi:MAG: hypothetical protein ABR912_05865 [Terracidiphilus sp.]|jgi:hypothetical protein
MSRFSVCRMRTLLGTLWVLVAGVILPAAPRSLAQSAASKSEAGNGTAKSLFCGYGSVGFMPDPLPPGFETQFAVAVVEIDSPSETRDAAVSGFVLFDEAGKTTESKRVVSVEVFKRPRVATEGEYAYYLNRGDKPGDTPPWNGTLPAGKIRLRIRVALAKEPISPVRFKLKIGQYVIEGPVDCAWPT